MTVNASSTRSSYDFTFALPSAFYEPILALLCQCYKPHRLSSAYLIYTNPLHSVTTRFSSAPAHRVAFPLPRSSVPSVYYAFLLHCYFWALLIITVAVRRQPIPFHRSAFPNRSSPLPFFPHLCHCFLHLFCGQVKPCFCVPDGKDIPFCAYLYETT